MTFTEKLILPLDVTVGLVVITQRKSFAMTHHEYYGSNIVFLKLSAGWQYNNASNSRQLQSERITKIKSYSFVSLHLKGKWRPRRSIIFGSWGAEEFGLIGSAEYTEVC